ncbi:hypothetical protein HDU76_005636 [Blyttiomyces sp. JEL0837]|nr:hypothetical protein HDU76_005636 [Blyttiomyces sp. JEL0837]
MNQRGIQPVGLVGCTMAAETGDDVLLSDAGAGVIAAVERGPTNASTMLARQGQHKTTHFVVVRTVVVGADNVDPVVFDVSAVDWIAKLMVKVVVVDVSASIVVADLIFDIVLVAVPAAAVAAEVEENSCDDND